MLAGDLLGCNLATMPFSCVEVGQKRRQQQQGAWNFSVATATVCLIFLLAVAPVQSSHFRSNSWGPRRLDLLELNATATVSSSWRTGYHFQPRRNWMNDPNGPLYYKGYYHLFYQYDPYNALWGNITWGHAVSTDLIRWKYLDDQAVKGGPYWYDIRGAWSGSATIMPDGTPVILYTGEANTSDVFQIQTQNLVFPDDPKDPLLRVWWKSERNPLIVANADQNASNFRDPTEGWRGLDGNWRTLIGSRQEQAGLAFVYTSPDFLNWTLLHPLHFVPDSGMWECPDFYPVSLVGEQGVDVSTLTGNLKHVLKASLDKYKKDAYTVGTYAPQTDTFTATDPSLDVGNGLLYDYGKFYASKSFFDPNTSRRILFGWINESTSDQNALIAGWSGLQSIPRQVFLDPASDTSIIQRPVQELDSLHLDNVTLTNLTLKAGTVVNITGVSGPQLDIQVQFSKPQDVQTAAAPSNSTFFGPRSAQNICSGNAAVTKRGIHGPFGLLVLADKDRQEQTAIYFYLISANSSNNGTWEALLCSDQSKSSLQIGTDETTFGSYIPIYQNDNFLTLRILVDRSVVESFAQGGRSVITTRVYPVKAINQAAQAFLFNNGTSDIQVASLTAWEVANINLIQFGESPSP